MTSPRLPSYGLALLLTACSSADAGLDGTEGVSASASASQGSSSDSGAQATTSAGPDVSTTEVPTGSASESESGVFKDFGNSSATATASDTDTDDTGDISTTSGGTTGEEPLVPVCGDSKVDEGEACDDGDGNSDQGACTLGCRIAICGDGLVQFGVEACDDGNQNDDDLCVAGCKAAACGDGLVGPGEACDDGNMVDDDLCGNDCAPPNCGDGKLQMNQGETCDDANKSNEDACLTTCVLASCGDGFVHADVETCDDGNPDDTDECTTLCKPASCDDGIDSGAETDVDCGGPTCVDCKLGDTCEQDTDCETSACVAGECVLPNRCKQIKDAHPEVKDGIYTIDPKGDGNSFEVWCDMTVDGGGWTSLVHLTDLDRLNFSIPHAQVAVSEATRFWIFAEKQNPTYGVLPYGGIANANYQANGAGPTDTGWTWNGIEWNNPNGCHVFQQLILVPTEASVPRSYGNPHYNGGQSFNAALTPAALVTASTISVAPVKNFPSIHIGCVGWNVLKDPILWVR